MKLKNISLLLSLAVVPFPAYSFFLTQMTLDLIEAKRIIMSLEGKENLSAEEELSFNWAKSIIKSNETWRESVLREHELKRECNKLNSVNPYPAS